MKKQTVFTMRLPTIIAISLIIASVFTATTTAQIPLSAKEKRAEPLYLDGARDPKSVGGKIEIGTVVPTRGPLAEMGQAVKSVIEAAFAEANLTGGINHHQLELKVSETGDSTAATRANLDHLINTENVFALTGTFIAGAETETVGLLAEQEIPLIGPMTVDPKIGSPLNRQVFYLLSGNAGQARALVRFISTKSDAHEPTLAVIYSRGQFNSGVFEAIKDEMEAEELPELIGYEYKSGTFDPAETTTILQHANPDAVFFVGRSQDFNEFLTAADRLGWYPQIFLPGVLGTSSEIFAAPIGFHGKIFFSVPTSPSDVSPIAAEEFRALSEKYRLSSKHLAAQIAAYASVKILMQALKQTGPNLSRQHLIQALETFNGYKTGLTPDITYGPNRRIGAMGAYVLMIDLKEKKFVPVSDWISVN
jgi:ABC-type branched-subunit amino acid transport system substrate-binding protein